MNFIFAYKRWIFVVLATLLIIAPQCLAQTYISTQTSGNAIVPGTTDTGNHCDDCTTSITLPFAYQFYDTFFTSATVSSNGTLQFVSNSIIPDNTALPATGFTYAIFPYWTDLDTGSTASGQGIFTSISGSAPNRIFNIEWRTQICCGNGAPTDIFEVRLYEGQRKYDILYGRLSFTGNYETTGAQKNATDYTQFQYNTPNTLFNGLNLSYSLRPTAGTASVSGSVAQASGSPVNNAVISMTDPEGNVWTEVTDANGQYDFANLPVGKTYIISVKSKNYNFAQSSQVLNVSQDLTGVNFIGQLRLKSKILN